MPKETFGDEIKAVVSWGRGEETIQVATMLPGQQVHVVDSPPSPFDGWYATLGSRAEVNRLIRTLRTARDQAFGRDE